MPRRILTIKLESNVAGREEEVVQVRGRIEDLQYVEILWCEVYLVVNPHQYTNDLGHRCAVVISQDELFAGVLSHEVLDEKAVTSESCLVVAENDSTIRTLHSQMGFLRHVRRYVGRIVSLPNSLVDEEFNHTEGIGFSSDSCFQLNCPGMLTVMEHRCDFVTLEYLAELLLDGRVGIRKILRGVRRVNMLI